MTELAIIGFVLMAILGAVIYAKNRFLPPSNRNFLRTSSPPERNTPPSLTGDEQIVWRDINVSRDAGEIGWEEINVPRDAGQIEWFELEPGDDTPVDEPFLNPDVPDDLDNILRDVIGTKDLCSQDIFHPGEKVYLCRLHKLAYHENSWRYLGCQCPVCGSPAHTGDYTLPGSI